MFTAIRNIGDKILDGNDDQFLEVMTIDIPVKNSNITRAEQYIVIIEFNTNDNSISFDLMELKENLPKRFLWVGNASSNSFQWLVTTNNLNFICSQTLPSLCAKLDENSVLKQKIEKIIDNCYTSFSDDIKERYKQVWDLKKLGIKEDFNPNVFEENLRRELEKKSKSGIVDKFEQKLLGEFTKIVGNHIRNQLFLNKNDEIVLFTIKIDGNFICDYSEYRKLIYENKVGEIFESSKQGICSACGLKGKTTSDTKRMDFKYYNTDKITFSSGIAGNFDKNLLVCEKCYKNILVGEAYIKNNMSTRVGSFPAYVIPEFLFGTNIGKNEMDRLSKQIIDSFNSAVTYKSLEDFFDRIDEFKELEGIKDNYVLNLLFHDSGGASQQFKILKLIKDVPPSRIREMRAATSKVQDIGNKFFGNSKSWAIELDKIYYLIPLRIRKNKKEITEPAKLLEIYDAIFAQNPISKDFLVTKFVELASIYRLKRFDVYNIPEPKAASDMTYDMNLIRSMLQANLCMLYLEILNNLQGGEMMNIEELVLSEDLREYIKKVKYNEQEVAMFLLGYLIAEIASAQHKEKLSRKPILDKISYQGMNKNKIIMLTSEIFEKLKQYKILSYNNEGIFAQYKMLLDQNINNWNLTDIMNVFYILSGYSYRTYKILTKS